MQSFTTIPEKRFIRLRPRNENSSVTVIEIFQQYLMVGTNNGLVAMFDMNSMSVSRIYNVNENHPVNQIITSKKEARFFVVCHNCFIEYSYFDERIRYRYRNSSVIKKVLTLSKPMLLIDERGNFFEYSNSVEFDSIIVPISGLRIEENIFIEEFRSYDPHNSIMTRPILLIKNNCVAVANIDLTIEERLQVYCKDILLTRADETIIICLCKDQYFYTASTEAYIHLTGIIFAGKLDEIGRLSKTNLIKTTSGYVNKMTSSENNLVVLTQNQQIEIFDVDTHTKRYHISCGHFMTAVNLLRNYVIVGTNSGAIITQELPLLDNEVCLKCRNLYFFEFNCVWKRCRHFVPQEFESLPLYI